MRFLQGSNMTNVANHSGQSATAFPVFVARLEGFFLDSVQLPDILAVLQPVDDVIQLMPPFFAFVDDLEAWNFAEVFRKSSFVG